jgi:hypothetical protein
LHVESWIDRRRRRRLLIEARVLGSRLIKRRIDRMRLLIHRKVLRRIVNRWADWRRKRRGIQRLLLLLRAILRWLERRLVVEVGNIISISVQIEIHLVQKGLYLSSVKRWM